MFFQYQLRPDIEERVASGLLMMEGEMKKVYEIGGLPQFQQVEDEVSCLKKGRDLYNCTCTNLNFIFTLNCIKLKSVLHEPRPEAFVERTSVYKDF